MELNISRTARAAVSLSAAPSGEAPTTSLLDWPLTVKEEDYLSAAELCSADGSETRPHTSRPHTSRPHTSRPHTSRPHTSRPHTSRPHTSLYVAIPDDRRRSSSTASQITSPGKSFATSTLPIVLGKIKWTTPPRVFLSERISRRTLRLRTSTFGRGPRLSTALRMRVASV